MRRAAEAARGELRGGLPGRARSLLQRRRRRAANIWHPAATPPPLLAEPEEQGGGALARRSSLLERHPKDWQGIQPQPSSCVPMPSEQLAAGTPRAQAPPALPPVVEQAPAEPAAEALSGPAAKAETSAALGVEPSIEETVPSLAGILPPPAPEAPVPKVTTAACPLGRPAAAALQGLCEGPCLLGLFQSSVRPLRPACRARRAR